MLTVSTPNGQPVDLFYTLEKPSQYALHQFQRTMNVSGYQGSPIYLFASYFVQNAVAASKAIYKPFQPNVLSHYERYLIYNPNFMKHMEFSSGSEYTTLSIFAHEIGHHFYGHADVSNYWGLTLHPWEKETQADYYSGFVLAKLGAQPKDLETTQRLIFSMWPSETHPDSFNRISSIVKGWKDGGGVAVAVDDLMLIYNKITNEMNRWY